MGRGNLYIIVATIEYEEYKGIKELLDDHSVLSIIKPHQVDEQDQPIGTLVDLYVSNENKAITLLSGNRIQEKVEPLHTIKVTGQLIKMFPFLNNPAATYLIYILLSAVIIGAWCFLSKAQLTYFHSIVSIIFTTSCLM